MGLFKKLTDWGQKGQSKQRNKKRRDQSRNNANRVCRFETMEQRRMLDADPIIAGITYLEGDAGEDTSPDHFEVTFQGGSGNTQMTQFVINGDQDASGDLSNGDMFFDVAAGGPGAGGFHKFQFDAANSFGITESDILNVDVSDDGLSLIVTMKNFDAGDKLAFTIDVDEVEGIRDDKIASGVEFEGTRFDASFVDQNYTFKAKDISTQHTLENGHVQTQVGGIFYDEYDSLFNTGNGLVNTAIDLNADNETNQADRTDGAIAAFDLEPKPIVISGHVYHDENINCVHDDNEDGIADVLITLQVKNENGQYETVATTQTNSEGYYEFGDDLDLQPGTYRIIETQPDGYLDVGASAGTVEGSGTGTVENDGESRPNIITEIVIPLGGNVAENYDFKEVLPATLSGHVWHDLNNDGVRDPGEEPIANVAIQITRVGSKNGSLDDPFASTDVLTVYTDENGFYKAENLPPGVYQIVEVNNYPSGNNPLEGFIDGKDSIGTGTTFDGFQSNDRFDSIELCAGENGINFDFGEIKPVEINGYVSITEEPGDCLHPDDPNHEGIEGVTIQLYDLDGNLIDETQTDADGFYFFKGLQPGAYTIVQVQPNGYVDAGQELGTAGGTSETNRFSNVNLQSGESGEMYNFCEIQYSSIDGYVHTELNGNKTLDVDAGEIALQGVKIELLDADGNVIETTFTDENGYYRFDKLQAGSYSVRQTQPDGYLDVGAIVGRDAATNVDGDGDVSENLIAKITIGAGQDLIRYNFCEAPPAKIQGRVWEDGPAFKTDSGVLPSDYRDQRDGVYQAGTDTPIAGVKMYLYFFNDLENGSLSPVPVTLDHVMGEHYAHLAGQPGNTPIWVLTDANGEYCFDGLPAGNYIVLQEQPEGFTDANDIVGSTTGFTYNSEVDAQLAPQTLANTFSTTQLTDAINGIQVQAGGVSIQNNFTEVRVEKGNDNPPGGGEPNPPSNPPTPPSPPLAPGLNLYRHQGPFQTSVVGGAMGIDAVASNEYSWHLSVVNAGNPRGDSLVAQDDSAVWIQASHLTEYLWARDDMDDAVWTFAKTTKSSDIEMQEKIVNFGMLEGLPLAGDFNGDGIDEVAVFNNGYWYIDIDGNGVWNKSDFVAKLGDGSDQPVVGDWDGDGKDDIGTFGPRWEKDSEAIRRDPGLPNPDNDIVDRLKNVPPLEREATDGLRVMRLSSRGQTRADLIDHVFEYGQEGDIAVAGDWNGNGIRSIGIFRDGTWTLDVDGNGRHDFNDKTVEFGRAGDIPVVGDFNGDGVEEIGVFRDGTWIIDINNNQEIDAADKVFEMGEAGDRPVVGDWDGDGQDDAAVVERKAS